MKQLLLPPMNRRTFGLKTGAVLAGVLFPQWPVVAAAGAALQAGEGRVDISPPNGITMGGFHYSPSKPRLITGVRLAPTARALVLRLGRQTAVIVCIDMLNVSRAAAQAVQRRVQKELGIPARNVRVCATHSHSMPSIAFNRQWGDQHPAYFAEVEEKILQAVRLAKNDLAPAELSHGESRAAGGNFNRTTKQAKTDADFTATSTDAERWLDTRVTVLQFERRAPKSNLLWYHFSAHPVCFTDSLAGSDWPGLVEQAAVKAGLPKPGFLQGHIGDVNPGAGDPWLGNAEKATRAVVEAVRQAVDKSRRVEVRRLRVEQQDCPLPLDLALFEEQVSRYRDHATECTGGEWVDASFARDWYDSFATKWDRRQKTLPSSLAAVCLGEVGILFHGAELYSYYGLAIRRDSPLKPTLVVGYADGYVGYLPDPRAYREKEYAAVVVPKILNYPPFLPAAAGELTQAAVRLLRKSAS